MTKPLIIYKASAGSGKTFTLTTQYIKLVVQNPQAYRQILAVTFTNKATEEMKMRILSQLYGIWKQLPASDNYCRKVCEALDASPEFVSKQAGIALTNLLHNYSYFRIDTIDSFFQSVLRNLARELDLTANLRVGLNDLQVEDMAVDQLIEGLSTHDTMLQWIMKYIMENISDDRSWNVIGQIKSFGRTIFKDFYKTESKQLYRVVSQPNFFEQYTKQLRGIRESARKRMEEVADAFFKELSDHGFDIDDLAYGKTGVAAFFKKLKKENFDESIVGSRVTDCKESPEKWCKKTHPRYLELLDLAQGKLMPLLVTACDERPQMWKLFQSADLTLRHLNQLRLLESIEHKVREINESQNQFLLSDTQQLLHDLIKGSDSPFIFEKIGTQLEHIMIDEFQDTSTVQWKNFKVLLEEAMSHEGSESLIVGDVKQSIYRWRSGDWRLLANIENEFPNTKDQLHIEPLDYNYRSDYNIIKFNNAFFTEAAKTEGVTAYNDVEQKVREGKPRQGYVSVCLLPRDNYEEQTLQRTAGTVRQLLDKQVKQSAIAILVRTNSQIPLIANYFMEYLPEVTIVSDEAFRLDASPAVQVIIQALRVLTTPQDLIAKACLAKAFSNRMLHEASLDDLLPEAFVLHTDELARLPLYELTERLYAIFHLHEMKGQEAYLCAFYDIVANFANDQMSDLPLFLREWDANFCSRTIQSPEPQGIRLISIHKSKGLEFPYVVIPFCDWKLEMSDTLWCRPEEYPFNALPIVPIDYSLSKTQGTVYEHDCNEEHQQNIVDNLNLLYVGFTRAVNGLFIIGKRGAKGSRSALIEQVLPSITPLLNQATIKGEEQKDTPLNFEYGKMDIEVPHDSSSPQEADAPSPAPGSQRYNVFLQKSTPIPIDIGVFNPKVQFAQSNDSQLFATPTDDDEHWQQQQAYIQTGSILHNIFASIRTTADIDQALHRLELDGILYDQHLTHERIAALIRKRIEHPRVADWYSGRWTLYNECTILSTNPDTKKSCNRRPDRVMTDGKQTIVVDFKFGKPCNKYKEQVQDYMQLLRDMGHPSVQGFLWYVYSNQIEEVK